MKSKKYSELTVENFISLFGTTPNDFPQNCVGLVEKNDFRYEKLSGSSKDEVLLNILKKIDLNSQTIAGKSKKSIWEQGWSENLKGFQKKLDINELIPKYYHPGRVLRLDRCFIKTVDPNFEFNFFKIFTKWLFKKYLNSAESIYEFGCGPGHNLIELSELFPKKNIYGLDWTTASQEIISKIGKELNKNITGISFNMFSPNCNIPLQSNSIALTIGSLEQLGNEYEAFLKFILTKAPLLCVNVEPLYELYDENNLFDYLAMKSHKKRNQLGNYLESLKLLEKKNLIEIIKVQRMFFGSLNGDGWSYVVWRPINPKLINDYK